MSEESTANKIYEFDELQQSMTASTRPPVIVICKFCNEECDEEEYDAHKEKCLHNPINMRDIQKSQDIINSDQSSNNFFTSDLFDEQNKKDDVVYIPCEFCIELIELNNYLNHQEICRQQQTHQFEEQKRCKIRKSIISYLCEYCQEAYSRNEFHDHQITCRENVLMH